MQQMIYEYKLYNKLYNFICQLIRKQQIELSIVNVFIICIVNFIKSF